MIVNIFGNIIVNNRKNNEDVLMQYGLDSNRDNDVKDFRQRVADQNIQSIIDRQDEIRHAKNGFIGMLAGIIVGGVVGWLFFGASNNVDKEKEIPIVRRSVTPAKVQPNDPGGMEIDNQNREIYHIVDNIPQEKTEVNVIPVPEMPKLVAENSIATPKNIENLVESIEEEGSLDSMVEEIKDTPVEKVQVANKELSAIKTNSNDKIIIPEKLKNIEVHPQKTINSEAKKEGIVEKVAESEIKKEESAPITKGAKGTWYAQIIASSSRKAVDNLWQQLSTKHTFLKAYGHEIEEISAANGSTLYRLKVGAFKTRKEAETLSDKLKQHQISSIIKQN